MFAFYYRIIKKTVIILYIILFLLTANSVFAGGMNKDFEANVKKIINKAMQDSTAWEQLAYLCDTFGPRPSGSESLNKALMWMKGEMQKDGLENVKAEEAYVPHWVRGREFCELVKPRKEQLHMIGLGGSIATPPEGITAPLLIVNSFEELKARAKEAKGKIVLFNKPWMGYGDAVQFRFNGAVYAAEAGAVASLIRSCSPIGMQNPHTGVMGYNDTIPKIPNAAISLEDAEMLERMEKRGQNPVVHLYMEAKTLPDVKSYNVMGEIKGSERPGEIIVVGGHTDCWDPGLGAQDDGGGAISAWKAVKLLKDLGIKPKCTIRAVMFVNEENGTKGGKAYAVDHKNDNTKLMFEFDSGVFEPQSIGFSGSDAQMETVKGFEPYLKILDDSISVVKGGWGVDISPLAKQNNIPVMSLGTNDEGKYFWYHHSATDTPDKVNPAVMNKCIAAIAISLYLYSETK